MPLDDIFYDKPRKSAAKKLEFFWQWCTISLGGIVSIIALFNNFPFLWIILLVWVTPLMIAFPSSKWIASIISYNDFSEKEREGIYFYIIGSLWFSIYLILLSTISFDLTILDWFY